MAEREPLLSLPREPLYIGTEVPWPCLQPCSHLSWDKAQCVTVQGWVEGLLLPSLAQVHSIAAKPVELRGCTEEWLRAQTVEPACICILAQSLTGWAASVPQFPHMQNGPNSVYLTELSKI